MRKNLWLITFTFVLGLVFLFASAPQGASAKPDYGTDCFKSGCHNPDMSLQKKPAPKPAPAPAKPAPAPAKPAPAPAKPAPAPAKPAPKAARAPVAPAHKTVSMAINGADTNIIMLDNRVLLSARGLGEIIGADVSWDNDTQGISYSLEGKTVTLILDKDEAKINGNDAKAPVNAQSIDGSNVVPVRFVAEALGLTVHYTELGLSIF